MLLLKRAKGVVEGKGSISISFSHEQWEWIKRLDPSRVEEASRSHLLVTTTGNGSISQSSSMPSGESSNSLEVPEVIRVPEVTIFHNLEV